MDAPLPLRRTIPRAAGAMLLPCLIGIGARMAGADMVVFLTATIVASILGLMVAIASLGMRRSWAMVVAILLYAVVPLIAAGVLTEARAIGSILDAPGDRIGQRPLAARFRFTDGAAPRAELAEVVTVVGNWFSRRGGPGRRQDTYAVAPVGPPGWTPDQPVPAVALAASRRELSRRVPGHDAWATQGGLLRLLDEDLLSRAVRQALARRGLAPADGLVTGAWVPGPGRARLEAMLPALTVLGAALAVVLGLALFDRGIPPRRAGRRA